VEPRAKTPEGGRGALAVGGGILLSRISGLLRERAIAHFFGTSLWADAWRAALRLPNVLQNLLGEGTLSAAFIPIYSAMEEAGRREAARRFAGAAFGVLLVLTGTLVLGGLVVAPWMVKIFFAGFDPERQRITTSLVRILFPMTGLLVLSAWCLGILNSHRRFLLSYSAPVLWNAAMIAALAVGGGLLDLRGESLLRWMAWGALIGGGLQFAVQLPAARRYVSGISPQVSISVEGMPQAIRAFLPVVGARGVVNLSGWLDYALAAFLATGAVAALGYAQTLYLLPISLFGMSVAASQLPEMSRRTAGAELPREEIEKGLDRVRFFLIPSAWVFLLLGDVVVSALYQTGSFGRPQVLLTWSVLAAYALGLTASGGSRLLSSAFYALRDSQTPARIAGLRVGLSLGVGGLLMFPLDRVSLDADLRLGAVGLALGASVGAWAEFFLLRRRLNSRLGSAGEPHRSVWFAQMVAGALGGILALAFRRVILPPLPPLPEGVLVLGLFGGIYLLTARILGVVIPLPSGLWSRFGNKGERP